MFPMSELHAYGATNGPARFRFRTVLLFWLYWRRTNYGVRARAPTRQFLALPLSVTLLVRAADSLPSHDMRSE